MKRVLITGGAGFIGLSLARVLEQEGIQLDLVDDFSRGKNDAALTALTTRKNVRCLGLDLSKPNATDGLDDAYDGIFHFAALLGVENISRRAYDALTLNAQLTVEALRLARRQKKLTAFVFASTSEVYAGSLRAGLLQFPTPETSLITLPPLEEPRTSYMLSKLYGEALVLHAGIPSVIIRPHNVYGPRMGMEHVVPQLMKRMHGAQPGSELALASSDHSRTFCFIDDSVEMIRRLAFDPKAVGGVWNIGSERPEHRILEVAEIIRRVVGADIRLVTAPDTPGSPVRRCPSMTKTEALTGYRQRVSLEEGIERTYRWYQKNWF